MPRRNRRKNLPRSPVPRANPRLRHRMSAIEYCPIGCCAIECRAIECRSADGGLRSPRSITTIAARTDVGFGNVLFIRGGGPGLSWDSGRPMICQSDDLWTFDVLDAEKSVAFKFLINDEQWSTGPGLHCRAGRAARSHTVFLIELGSRGSRTASMAPACPCSPFTALGRRLPERTRPA